MRWDGGRDREMAQKPWASSPGAHRPAARTAEICANKVDSERITPQREPQALCLLHRCRGARVPGLTHSRTHACMHVRTRACACAHTQNSTEGTRDGTLPLVRDPKSLVCV